MIACAMPARGSLIRCIAYCCNNAASDAGIETHRLPEGMRVRRRGQVTFAFNFGAGPLIAPAPETATFVLGSRQLHTGDVCAWLDHGTLE